MATNVVMQSSDLRRELVYPATIAEVEDDRAQIITLQTDHRLIAPGNRVYAFTDIHGNADVLQASLELIKSDLKLNPPSERQLVSLVNHGDIDDKGPDTRKCIDILSGFDGVDEKINLVGNHDKFLIDFVNGPAGEMDIAWVNNSAWWIGWARGLPTLQNYGVVTPYDFRDEAKLAAAETCGYSLQEDLMNVRADFIRALEKNDHINYFNSLATTATCQRFVFCHAQIMPDKPVQEHTIEDVIKGRDILEYDGTFMNDAVVVYGHSSKNTRRNRKAQLENAQQGVVTPPFIKNRSIGIDPDTTTRGKPFIFVLNKGHSIRFLREDGCVQGPVFPYDPNVLPGSYPKRGNGEVVPMSPNGWKQALAKFHL